MGQSLDVQFAKLIESGCLKDKIFSEKKTANYGSKRLELSKAIGKLSKGYILLITRIDRLARSLSDLLKIVNEIKKKEASLKGVDQTLDTRTSEGNLLFNILGVVVEFEYDIRR